MTVGQGSCKEWIYLNRNWGVRNICFSVTAWVPFVHIHEFVSKYSNTCFTCLEKTLNPETQSWIFNSIVWKVENCWLLIYFKGDRFLLTTVHTYLERYMHSRYRCFLSQQLFLQFVLMEMIIPSELTLAWECTGHLCTLDFIFPDADTD